MKKLLFAFTLLLGLSLSNIMPLQAAQSSVVSPTLKAVLKKKFIERKPLTEQEQVYLKKASYVAIVAGLAALGISAAAAMSTYDPDAREAKEEKLFLKKYGENWERRCQEIVDDPDAPMSKRTTCRAYLKARKPFKTPAERREQTDIAIMEFEKTRPYREWSGENPLHE